MQYAYRNRSGPGIGTLFLVAIAAFALVFAFGLLRPSGSVDAYDRIQRLSWTFSNLRARDFDLAALIPWAMPGTSSAPAAADAGQKAAGAAAERSYRVEAGDSLSRIAARFGVEVAALVSHNGLSNPDLLEVGQTLRIPGDSAIEPAAKAAPVAAPRSPHSAATAPPAVSSGPPAAPGALDQIDALLAMADEELSEARFERALHTSLAVERLLGPAGDSESAEVAARRVRMEVVRATAYTAVGHHQQVQQALARALDADPGLELDPDTISPKLLSALDVAREIRASEAADVALGESAGVTP